MTVPDIQRLKERYQTLLWESGGQALPWPKAFVLSALRILIAVGRDFAKGDLTLRATSLVYTTLLSLVPLLALSFSVLKAFGVHNQLEPLLINFLAPLGEKGAEIASNLVQFVENMGVGVLGSLGLALLIYTVVSLIQKIEDAFNFIWHVTTLRPLSQRLSGYLSVVMLGPLLIFSAMGLTATVMNSAIVQGLLAVEPFGTLFYGFSKLLPYLLVSGAFTVTYMVIPNTRVRISSALVGGVVAGVLWESIGWGFAAFVVGSTKYTAVYSSFAIIILFFIWVYISWLILLLGATITFYHQNPASCRAGRVHTKPRTREALALEVMYRVALAHRGEGKRWSLAALADALLMPEAVLKDVVDSLLAEEMLLVSGEEPPTYLPGRDLDLISVNAVLLATRGGAAADSSVLSQGVVQQTLQQRKDLLEERFGSQTLAELVTPQAVADGDGRGVAQHDKVG